MEEGSPEIFQLNSRLAAASTPELDDFARENLAQLATTASRRYIAEEGNGSGGRYEPAVVYDISPALGGMADGGMSDLRRGRRFMPRDEHARNGAPNETADLINLGPQELDHRHAVTISVREHEDSLRLTQAQFQKRLDSNERDLEEHYRARVEQLMAERDTAQRRCMDMEERNRAEYAQELDGTAERLRMANRGRESGLYGAEKRNSVQIALGLSMAKNTATELKKQEAVADVLAKTLTGVVLSPISSIADIMAVVNRILPMVCTLPGGKTFSAVISEGFEFVADGSVAGHVDLLGRVADAMEQVPVSAIDMKVINKLQEADRPLAIKQRKAHLAIQMDTTFVSIDVIVYKALISTLDQTMQKTVATTTSTIEMLAAIWIFKNYGWYTRSKEAVKGLTKPHVFDVNPQTSFDTVVDELIQDIRSRLEPVQKTGLSTLGMAVMMSLESLPRNKDPLQAQMLTEVEVAARSTTHQSDLTFQ